MISFLSLTNTYVYNIVKTNFKKHLFHSISMTYHVDLTKQRLTWFLLTILPQSLLNILVDLSYSAFVSKLFISSDSLILHSCISGNFKSVFGCSQLKRPWKYLECSVVRDTSHFPARLSSWCLTDRVNTRFFVSPMHSPPRSPPPHNYNLIFKHLAICLEIVYFCCCIVCFSLLQLM